MSMDTRRLSEVLDHVTDDPQVVVSTGVMPPPVAENHPDRQMQDELLDRKLQAIVSWNFVYRMLLALGLSTAILAAVCDVPKERLNERIEFFKRMLGIGKP